MFNEIPVVSASVVGCGDTRALAPTSMCSYPLIACNFPGVAVKIEHSRASPVKRPQSRDLETNE